MFRSAIILVVAVGMCLLAGSLMGPTASAIQEGVGTSPQPSLPEVGPEFYRMQHAELLFLATLTRAQAGPVAMSEPPIYTFHLTLTVSECLRGDLPEDEAVTVSYQVRQADPPQFAFGEAFVVAAYRDLRIERMNTNWAAPATEALLIQARLAGTLPLGWTIANGKLLSPWASMGEDAWPGLGGGKLICAETGRPPLLAGEGVRLTAEPVPPAEEIRWTNPDGDGEYTITVTNTTDQALEVPALLTVGGEIAWNESLIVICQG
ncbi:MAG: hypothetical protein ACYTFO_03240, partial [Planctomycetota bacterium]